MQSMQINDDLTHRHN